MRILYLTFYFEPDLCAGSFRNTTLVKEISKLLNHSDDLIHVVTTMPNRYNSYNIDTIPFERVGNIEIDRIILPSHQNGFADQANSYKTYFFEALRLTKNQQYDLIFASSSRLFTAFLGRCINIKKNKPFYIDVRDIFVDTMQDIIKRGFIRYPLILFLKVIENFVFSGAGNINLISEGFKPYFFKYSQVRLSYFTNGIDNEFLKLPGSKNIPSDEYIITYAGNIGEGQGLEKIIPEAAKLLGPKYKFRIIGDGGKKQELIEILLKENIKTVELIPPTSRENLLRYYEQSHFLFLHLNNYKAFEKVLPSKIFEYGATDKPIIAGVGGYAAKFVKDNLSNFILFSPGDTGNFVLQLKEFKFRYHNRILFKNKFARATINKQMAISIITTASPDRLCL